MTIPSKEHLVRQLEENDDRIFDLATEFFIMFSRFEYAMKQTSKYRGGTASNPKADWRKLSDSLAEHIESINDDDVRTAVERLVTRPPKRIIVVDEQLVWQTIQPRERVSVFSQVQQVRNNLFHGGKFLKDDENRNVELIRDCCIVLRYFLQKDKDLLMFYSAL